MPCFLAMSRRSLSDGALADAFDQGVIGDDQLVNSDAAAVAEVAALLTAAGFEEGVNAAGDAFHLAFFVHAGGVGFFAILAELANEALGHDADDGCADEIGFDADIVEAGDSRRARRSCAAC